MRTIESRCKFDRKSMPTHHFLAIVEYQRRTGNKNFIFTLNFVLVSVCTILIDPLSSFFHCFFPLPNSENKNKFINSKFLPSRSQIREIRKMLTYFNIIKFIFTYYIQCACPPRPPSSLSHKQWQENYALHLNIFECVSVIVCSGGPSQFGCNTMGLFLLLFSLSSLCIEILLIQLFGHIKYFE